MENFSLCWEQKTSMYLSGFYLCNLSFTVNSCDLGIPVQQLESPKPLGKSALVHKNTKDHEACAPFDQKWEEMSGGIFQNM